MKRILFVNGSPKGENSTSKYLIDKVIKNCNEESQYVWCNDINSGSCKIEIDKFHSMVFVFPLYVDCIPAILLECMKNIEKSIKKDCKIYAIVNCGFFEGIQCKPAIEVISNFTSKVGGRFSGGIGLGAGGFLEGSKNLEEGPKKSIVMALKSVSKAIES